MPWEDAARRSCAPGVALRTSGRVRGAGKKVKGRKRHLVTDRLGLRVGLAVHGADVQDRDGAPKVLKSIRARRPWLRVRPAHSDGPRPGPHRRGRRLCGAEAERRHEPLRRLDHRDPQAVRCRSASRSCRADGPSSEPSPGWQGPADWPRTGRNPSPPPRPGSSSPIPPDPTSRRVSGWALRDTIFQPRHGTLWPTVPEIRADLRPAFCLARPALRLTLEYWGDTQRSNHFSRKVSL